MTMEPQGREPTDTIVAWSFVAMQVLILVAIVLTPRGDDWLGPEWLDVAAIGCSRSASHWDSGRPCAWGGTPPSPVPNGAVGLVTRGPYRWVRHPMYTAVILIVVGIAARSGSIVILAETAALVVLFNLKARWEEHRLTEIFPGYPRYREVTGRFLPVRRHGASGR